MKTFTLLLILLITTLNCLANEANNIHDKAISLTIKDNSVIYGKKITLYLRVQKKSNIEPGLFLKPLKDITKYTITEIPGTSTHRIYKLKVAPLAPGSMTIPPLSWKNTSTKAIKINITQPLSTVNSKISVTQNKVNTTPWEKEQTVILVTVITKDKNIILNRKNIIHPGVESYLLKHAVKTIHNNSGTVYKHTIGWAVYFLYRQKTKLVLPEVEYLVNSVPRYKFNFKSLAFRVKKLPIYISPLTPVGTIQLDAEYIDNSAPFMQPGSTAIVQYTLSAKGIPAKWLPSIARFYNTTTQKSMQYSHVKTTQNTIVNSSTLESNKVVDIAFTPSANGLAPFKNIHLQYFNPQTDKLETLDFKHQKLILLDRFLQMALLLVIAYSLYRLSVLVIKFLLKLLHKYKYHQRFLNSVSNSTTCHELKESLKLFAIAEGWGRNISINTWLLKYKNRYRISNKLESSFHKLNRILYSEIKMADNENELKKLKENFYFEIKNRKKISENRLTKTSLTCLF